MRKNDIVLFEKINLESQVRDDEYGTRFFNLCWTLEDMAYYRKQIGAKEDYLKDLIVYFLIDSFTLENSEDIFKFYFQYTSLFGDVLVKKNDNNKELIIKTSEYEIKARRLTEVFPDVIKGIKRDLNTSERYNKCHELSSSLAFELKQDNNLVTAFTYGFTDKSRYYHSFVETIYNGEEVVIDGTLNAVMNKDAYYKMRHIKEVLEVLSQKEIKEDFKKYQETISALGFDDRDLELVGREIYRELDKQAKKGVDL